MRQRQTTGITPPAPSSKHLAEELKARSQIGTLKLRRNPWHWRDRTPLDWSPWQRTQRMAACRGNSWRVTVLQAIGKYS